MRKTTLTLLASAALAVLAFAGPTSAQTALTGLVTSAEEGAMEGVLVTAKKDGSTISITVVTDAQGRYSFPAAKLDPGRYSLRIRAVGYDLEGKPVAEVAAGGPATGVPPISNSPPVISVSPAIQRRNVVLPQPLGPTMQRISLSRTARFSWRNATTVPSRNILLALRATIASASGSTAIALSSGLSSRASSWLARPSQAPRSTISATGPPPSGP